MYGALIIQYKSVDLVHRFFYDKPVVSVKIYDRIRHRFYAFNELGV